ncbi:hypothetical protein DFH94DRAFT_722874 [Russula ochroleuca]|jgi:murein tripeptide amidase MpaA|uniref:Peptidase M14 domain-containing protein n=1 Tax=Russula ochroleuca TaxID=152965 RepID=A0A9P5N0W7_9AGAM|nr:hypothetical protein DFH94DRAFT_722874 [Russula ochroleuca]
MLSRSLLAFIFLLYTAILFSWAIPVDDDSGIIYRFSPASSNEIEELLSWAELREWDLWQTSRSYVDVYFPRRAIAEAELGLLPFHLPPSTSHRVDKDNRTSSCTPALRAERAPPCSSSPIAATRWDVVSPSNATFHAQYHPLDEIQSFVRDLAAAYPQQVAIVPLGHSGQGREMFALEISAAGASRGSHDQNSQVVLDGKGKVGEGASPRCGFLVTGAQHAREWVASASALYIAHALLADPSEKFSLARLLERHNFYIVPVPNPDGYVYTWERDRFWYKNRLQLDPKARCIGVDMNRNWGYKWKAKSNEFQADKSGRKDPCSDWYPGNRPFQAPEVNNMENYFSRLPRLKGFLDLRSYGQMLSIPFSYSCKKSPKDAEDQLEAISGAAHAIKKSHGMQFTTGALCSTLYRAPGNIVDWMYKKMGVKYSFAAHLRDTGTYGFALPEQWIRPVGEETAMMVESLADFIAGTGKECR